MCIMRISPQKRDGALGGEFNKQIPIALSSDLMRRCFFCCTSSKPSSKPFLIPPHPSSELLEARFRFLQSLKAEYFKAKREGKLGSSGKP